MKKSVKFILSLLVISVLFIVIFKESLNTKDDVLVKIQKNEISEKIHCFLEERASVMISDEKIINKYFLISEEAMSEENKQRKEISLFREKLKENNEAYSMVKTKVGIKGVMQLSESKIALYIKEETSLMSSNEEKTGYSMFHEFIVEKDNNDQWAIVEDRQLEPSGLMPLDVAERFVYKKETYFNI